MRGARGEVDLGELAAVGVEDVDGAELIEVEPEKLRGGGRRGPRARGRCLRGGRGADAGAVVALLDFVPPALALVFDHGGLFDEDARAAEAHEEIEQGELARRRRGRRTPSRERRWLRRCGVATCVLQLGWLFAAFERCSGSACAREAGVDGGEELFGDGSFGERQQQGFVERGAERCVSGSKRRMDSISSPKKSMRTGRSISGE